MPPFAFIDDAKDSTGMAVMAVTSQDYEKLAEWTAQLLKALEQKNSIIGYYLSCITEFNNTPLISSD